MTAIKMKACVHKSYGPPEVVQIKEIDIPIPKESEILIKIMATTVNRTDCGFRSAQYFVSRFFSGLLRPKYQILGNEFAGTVIAIGEKVTLFSIGDRVFGYDDSQFGGHAEFKTIRQEDAVAAIPENISFIQAAPICEGAHYAWGNIKAAKVKSGHNTMVYGATGAIGSAAVQLLKNIGANVTAVCATPQVELIQSLGSDLVIDYLKEDFTKINQQFDFIFDAVGKSSFGICKPLLKDNGIYISTELGKNSENIFLAISAAFSNKKRVLFPLPSIDKNDVNYLKQLVIEGKFRPLIDRMYKIDEIVEAYHYVETGQKIGNVVILVNEEMNHISV
jgi:NADPH:quinone reductase-like Zn-dependent oxidoreductase